MRVNSSAITADSATATSAFAALPRSRGLPATASVARKDSSDHRLLDDSADPTDAAEPIENSDPAEPIDPIDSTDPIDPIDSTELADPIDNTESVDHKDHLLPPR